MGADRLLQLAERLAAREPVDWDEEIQSTREDEERAVVSSMRLLAELSALYSLPGTKQTSPRATRHSKTRGGANRDTKHRST